MRIIIHDCHNRDVVIAGQTGRVVTKVPRCFGVSGGPDAERADRLRGDPKPKGVDGFEVDLGIVAVDHPFRPDGVGQAEPGQGPMLSSLFFEALANK